MVRSTRPMGGMLGQEYTGHIQYTRHARGTLATVYSLLHTGTVRIIALVKAENAIVVSAPYTCRAVVAIACALF